MSSTDIAILFARDPLKLTRDDIDKIVAELRTRRRSFDTPTSELVETLPGVKSAKKRAPTKKDKLIEGLDDIEIEL